jgi:non-ribosomal peptide synthetase component F
VLLPAAELPAATVEALLAIGGVEQRIDGDAPLEPGPIPGTPGEDGVALLLATSGSTGQPKLVPITRGAIARFSAWAADRFEIGPGTRVLSYCGLSFDLSILEVWCTLVHGGCVVLATPEQATRPRELTQLARDVSVIQGVPLLYTLLQGPLPNVRHAILTGDATPMTLLKRLPELLPHARLYNVYGCTETNDSFVHEIDVERELALGAIPLGEPIEGVQARVVDGELWVRTPFQADGYVSDADGFHRSRDLVRRDADGRLFLDGRTDSQVKIRGHRVNLQAVERCLGDDVAEIAVFAVEGRLVAVVRGDVNTLALRARVAHELGRHAVPSTIEVQAAPLPRTTTGKVDRNAVRADWIEEHP